MPCPHAALPSPPARGASRPYAALRLSGSIMALAAIALCLSPRALAINIQFDYSHNSNLEFFGTAQNPSPARIALEFAARAFTPFTDTLSAIQPGGANSWTAQYIDPSTNTIVGVPNLAVPQNTVVVYALARDLAGANLGQASPGWPTLGNNASSTFQNTVRTRGQGDASVDFAAWGGVIAVDVANSSGAARNWHFDVNSAPSLDEYDFLTVVTHELAHLLGFGVSPAFSADVSDNMFTGAHAQALYGGTVPLAGGQHWASGVTSPPFLPGTQPKPSLGPSLTLAERKLFTPLDYAALADIGWEVPPELFTLPADFNGDAVVDGADFLTWQRNYGGFGGSPGDANGDLRVDDFDGFIVRNYLGSQGFVPEWLSANAAVPEPAAASLAMVGLFAFASRRRR